MKHSAAEFVNASRVALIVSAENYTEGTHYTKDTYHTLSLNDVDRWVNEVLGRQRNTVEEIVHGCN